MAWTRKTDWLADHKRHAAAGLELGQGAAGLDGDMGLGLGGEFALDDDVALRPGGIDIAFLEARARGDIAELPRRTP